MKTKANRHLKFLQEVEGSLDWAACYEFPIENPPEVSKHLASHTEGDQFMWMGQHRLGVAKVVHDDPVFQQAVQADGGTKYDPLA